MRLLIADDHPIMRIGIRELVRKEWPEAAIEEAETIDEACRKIAEWKPGVIVLDLVMPDVAGTEGVARVLAVADSVPILVLSFNAESAYAGRLLKMGVAGYLPKDQASQELVRAVRRVSEGRRYVTAGMAEHLVDLLGGRAPSHAPHELLSAQEYRVMLLIAAGQPPAQIAEAMGLSVKTVGTYRARIFEKTGWRSNAELTKYCVQQGLMSHG